MPNLLVRLGVPESEPGDRIGALARAMCRYLAALAPPRCPPWPGHRARWTRRAAGRRLTADDVLSLIIGPVFPGWESDLGRTCVPGDTSRKQLLDDIGGTFARGQARCAAEGGLTAAQLDDVVTRRAASAG